MLKVLHILFSVSAFGLAIYGLITNNFQFQGLMFFLLGLTMLVMAIQEFQSERKKTGWLLIISSIFSLFVSVQNFII